MPLSGATPNVQPLTLLSFRVSFTEAACERSTETISKGAKQNGACCADVRSKRTRVPEVGIEPTRGVTPTGF